VLLVGDVDLDAQGLISLYVDQTEVVVVGVAFDVVDDVLDRGRNAFALRS
jgi:hypothetical protein